MSGLRLSWLVARREIRERIRSRAYLVSTGLVVAGVIVLVLILSATGGDGVSEVDVAAEGPAAETALTAAIENQDGLDLEITRTEAASMEAAEASIRQGDLDAAVGPAPEGFAEDPDHGGSATGELVVLISESSPDRLGPYLEQIASSAELDRSLSEAGLSPEQAREVTDSARVAAVTIAREDTDSGGAGIAFIATLLLYIAILGAGYAVSSGVVEEKSSRVVELLLNTVKPRNLLAGKVAGIGIVSLLQFGAVIVAGLIAALAVGNLDLPEATASTAVLAVVYFILGYIFFGCAFAAAGAIVSRQEDSNSTTTPLMLVLVGGYLLSFSALDNPDAPLAQLLSYIPPLAPMIVPARAAADALPPEQLALSLAAMVAGCAILIWAAGKIYERAVLRMGAPLNLRETVSLLRR